MYSTETRHLNHDSMSNLPSWSNCDAWWPRGQRMSTCSGPYLENHSARWCMGLVENGRGLATAQYRSAEEDAYVYQLILCRRCRWCCEISARGTVLQAGLMASICKASSASDETAQTLGARSGARHLSATKVGTRPATTGWRQSNQLILPSHALVTRRALISRII